MFHRPTLMIDFGFGTSAAMVVTDQGSWLVPDPVSGEGRWPSALFWDGQRMLAGTAADQRGPGDPGSFAGAIKLVLSQDAPVMMGERQLRPVELVAEFFAALRLAAQRLLGSAAPGGPIERAAIMIPASLGVTDQLRSQLVGAAEAAGFTAVELLPSAAAAVWAPGSPLRVGDTALVYDLGGYDPGGYEVGGYDLGLRREGAWQRGGSEERTGPNALGPATFEAVLIRVGDDLPQVIGHAVIVDWPSDPAAAVDLTLACCRDLLGRPGVGHVNWVLPVGGGVRAPSLAPALGAGLGIPVAQLEEPELAVVRGAAAWLPRSGPRAVLARPAGGRLVPLAFTIPGGGARLLRWVVEPQQPFDEGATVARVRLAGGAIFDLTARSRGILDEVLTPGGSDVRSGEWLALARPH